MDAKISLLERAGQRIIEREHLHGIEAIVDDYEYIPSIRRIIESLSSSLIEEGISENDITLFNQRLHDYAMNLYINLWMKHAEEEGEATSKEMKKAKHAFDEYYLGKEF